MRYVDVCPLISNDLILRSRSLNKPSVLAFFPITIPFISRLDKSGAIVAASSGEFTIAYPRPSNNNLVYSISS
jgi:hypothetical protein